MEVILAKSAGFCYGVRRAVELATGAVEEGRRPAMLGPVIHNAAVIRSAGITIFSKTNHKPTVSATIRMNKANK